MDARLAEAVERAYAAFSAFKPGAKLAYYPLWTLSDDEERTLTTTTLRRLPSALLGKYVKAVTAFGRPDDSWWPYFVPRVLELTAAFDWPHPYGAYAALSLLHGEHDLADPHWRSEFDPDQVAVLDQFAGAFWGNLIRSPYHCITEPHHEICAKLTGGAGVRELAEMFVEAGFPVEILFGAFAITTGDLPDVWLAAFINQIVDEEGEVDFELRTGVKPSHMRKRCEAWIDEAIARRLTLAFFRETRPREQVVISRAEERVRRLRARR
jgi:hypothetical protein